ncbi:MAG: hypothetical protein R2795_19890 [Saprospiraceae bacterium]
MLSQSRIWYKVAILNFVLATLAGALLRFAFVKEITWLDYKNVLHAHSHVAMLGWIFPVLVGLLVDEWIQPDAALRRTFTQLLYANQVAVLGMYLTFPVQGYAAGSIFFSSLQVVVSYVIVYQIIKAARSMESTWSGRWIKTGLVFLLVSSLGLWAIGPITAGGMRASIWFYLAVQFYLHFQFNGWFIFTVVGLLLRAVEVKGIKIRDIQQRSFFIPAAFLPTYLCAGRSLVAHGVGGVDRQWGRGVASVRSFASPMEYDKKIQLR